ncbi:MAG TPA: hotdog fold thioesterase [Aliicoccus persicus]|uniref:Hotdog fold thioesterase n=1 Tax=Aliicoccus persicus TaxID=930138 RepID=A0A921DY38_9STAP|nr:hotdog fold thioesterase [Aliicoccus persicus]
MDINTGLIEFFEIEEVSRTDDTLVMKMPVTERIKQPVGYVHGGAYVTLAETVASLGAFYSIDLNEYLAFGQEINANHVRATREGVLYAYGKAMHKGRTSQVWIVDIKNEQDQLVCTSRCTVAITKKR